MDLRHAVEVIGLAVDAASVADIVVAIGIAGVTFARGLNRDLPFDASYRTLRQSIGRGILLGLELLVAGDIIRTVAIAPTFTSVGVLAMIVAIRTFLSFSLEVELTRRWRWPARRRAIVAGGALRQRLRDVSHRQDGGDRQVTRPRGQDLVGCASRAAHSTCRNTHNHVAFQRCGQDSRSVMWSGRIATCSVRRLTYSYVTKLSTKPAESMGG